MFINVTRVELNSPVGDYTEYERPSHEAEEEDRRHHVGHAFIIADEVPLKRKHNGDTERQEFQI